MTAGTMERLGSDETYAARTRQAVEVLRDAGLRQGVFVSTGRHLFTEMDPLIWLTGFKPMKRACASLDDTGYVRLFVEGRWEAGRAADAVPGLPIVESDDPFAAAGAALDAAQPVGIAGWRRISALEERSLTVAGRLGLRDIDAALDTPARRKDAHGMTLLRRATVLAEDAFDHLRAQLKIGMTDVEAEALIELRLRELGSEDAFVLLSASVHNRAVQNPWGRILVPGDIILMEISPLVGGIATQICRTVSIGEPSAQLVDAHELLRRAFLEGLAACTPGNAVADVVAAVDALMTAEGYGDYCRPPFMRVRGHGMGLGSVTPGDISRGNQTVLREGDTFVLHPNQLLPGVGYLMCGEPIVVRNGGGEILSSELAQLHVVGH